MFEDKKTERVFIGDSLTTAHIEKGLTTNHLQQRLANNNPVPNEAGAPPSSASAEQNRGDGK